MKCTIIYCLSLIFYQIFNCFLPVQFGTISLGEYFPVLREHTNCPSNTLPLLFFVPYGISKLSWHCIVHICPYNHSAQLIAPFAGGNNGSHGFAE